MAQTSKQHKLSDSARAHSASVTSYTIAYSSGLIRLLGVTVNGEILSRKTSDSSASSNETKHSNPKLVSISLTPVCWGCWFASLLSWPLRCLYFDKLDVDQDEFKGPLQAPWFCCLGGLAVGVWSICTVCAGEGVA